MPNAKIFIVTLNKIKHVLLLYRTVSWKDGPNNLRFQLYLKVANDGIYLKNLGICFCRIPLQHYTLFVAYGLSAFRVACLLLRKRVVGFTFQLTVTL
jgi:hypothetical protein